MPLNLYRLKERLNFSKAGALRYLKNTSWMLLDKTLAIVSSFVIGIWLARYLGPGDYGVYSYVNAYISLFSVIAVFGIDSILVRELVEGNNEKEIILGTAAVLRLLAAMLALAAAMVGQKILGSDPPIIGYTLVVGCSLIFSAFNVIALFFQSEVKSKYAVIANSLCIVCSGAIKVYLLMNGAELKLFMWLILFEACLLAFFLFSVYIKKVGSPLGWGFDFSVAKELIIKSFPLMLSGAVVVIYMKVDQLMLEEMLGFEAVGNYAAAARLSEFWYFIPTVLVGSLFPALIHARQIDRRVYNERMQMLTDVVLWVAMSAVFFILIFGGLIIDILFGSEYAAAKPVLMVHVVAGVFAALGIASANWFIQEGLQKLLFYRSAMGAIANVILNFALIPRYGITGAALATLIAQMVSGYLFNVFDFRTRVLFYIQSKAFFAPLRVFGGGY